MGTLKAKVITSVHIKSLTRGEEEDDESKLSETQLGEDAEDEENVVFLVQEVVVES